MTKLNVLLAQTDQLGSVIKKNLTDAIGIFKNKQAHFKGEKSTYTEREAKFADPSKNVDKPVPSTVREWLGYTFEVATQYLTAKLDQESTNCSGTAKAELIIDGVNYGLLTSGELMALKGFFEQQALKDMLESQPTISLSERWSPSTNPEYTKRGILESPVQEWLDKETEKVQEVSWDPSGKQPGIIVNISKTIEKAEVTRQLFTGEISHIEKAEMLARLTKITLAIKAALEKANNTEVVPSQTNVVKLLQYLKG